MRSFHPRLMFSTCIIFPLSSLPSISSVERALLSGRVKREEAPPCNKESPEPERRKTRRGAKEMRKYSHDARATVSRLSNCRQRETSSALSVVGRSTSLPGSKKKAVKISVREFARFPELDCNAPSERLLARARGERRLPAAS